LKYIKCNILKSGTLSENKALGRTLRHKTDGEKNGENYILRGFMVCTLLPVLIVSLNRETDWPILLQVETGNVCNTSITKTSQKLDL
jgi:hypothetical protein